MHCVYQRFPAGAFGHCLLQESILESSCDSQVTVANSVTCKQQIQTQSFHMLVEGDTLHLTMGCPRAMFVDLISLYLSRLLVLSCCWAFLCSGVLPSTQVKRPKKATLPPTWTPTTASAPTTARIVSSLSLVSHVHPLSRSHRPTGRDSNLPTFQALLAQARQRWPRSSPKSLTSPTSRWASCSARTPTRTPPSAGTSRTASSFPRSFCFLSFGRRSVTARLDVRSSWTGSRGGWTRSGCLRNW